MSASSRASINDALNDQASARLTRRPGGARPRSLRQEAAWPNRLWTFRKSIERHGCGRGPQGPRHWPPAGNTTLISRWLFCSINQTAQGGKKAALQNQPGHARGSKPTFCQGRPVPECAFTMEMSAALIEPLAFTSSRKFDAPTDCPLCDLVWLISAALATRFALVSPSRTLIGMETSPVLVPSLTLKRVSVSVCALATLLRLTVTTEPLMVTASTCPLPDVTAACGFPLIVTGLAKNYWPQSM